MQSNEPLLQYIATYSATFQVYYNLYHHHNVAMHNWVKVVYTYYIVFCATIGTCVYRYKCACIALCIIHVCM